MLYKLHNDCPVKWTALQERSISREFPFSSGDVSAEDQTLRTYHQFLWLPESIMPLNRLAPALRLVANRHPSPGPESSAPQTSAARRLRRLLAPLLQTPRLVSQKYRTRVAQLLIDEGPGEEGETSIEDEIMFYALKNDKGDGQEGEDEAAVDERWRKALLERMERREVMMQILVHFLLLTEMRFESPETEPNSPVVSAQKPPGKRRRKDPTGAGAPSVSKETVDEHLEMFMDKLAMWQLMGSLDEGQGSGSNTKPAAQSAKGKGKEPDERDWMQIFCEDIVEAQFKHTLADECDLLRSKVFRSSPFAEDSDGLDLTSPPASPKGKSSALKLSRANSRVSSRPDERHASELSRTRSLSITLEEERVRERSRSLSIGPQKRGLVREVSMTTAFKGKTKATRPAARSNDKGKRTAAEQAPRPSASDRHGTTLVAATPVKPKQPRTQSQSEPRDRLPMLFENAEFFGQSVEGDDDDDEWMIQSSPDILLLDSSGGKGVQTSRILAEATPTKKRKTS